MSWAWTTWLDEAWRAPAFPVWVTLTVACVAALVLLMTLMRAETSAATGALAIIALLAIGIAAVATLRGLGEDRDLQPVASAAPSPSMAFPALACLDELAGDTVQAACEGALFGSPDHVAAAVSYVAGQIDRLAALGGAAAATTAQGKALRNALQRDRYGLTAYLLTMRDGCTPTACAAFRSFADTSRIVANMTARTYDAVVGRHMLSWSGPQPGGAAPENGTAATAAAAAAAAMSGLPPSVPTGRPTTIDYPTSDSIPPVSIMSGEPPPGAAAPATAPQPAARAQTPQPRPAPPPARRPSKSQSSAPVQLAPAAPGGDNR